MMNYQDMLRQIEAHIKMLYNLHEANRLAYHNLDHTQRVVNRSIEIAEHYAIGDRDMFILLAAAWFHDAGHLVNAVKGHEAKSVQMMTEYLSGIAVDNDLIKKIEQCITATIIPSNPQTFVERILCDADLYNLGTDEFKITDPLVKKEMETTEHKVFTNWDEMTLAMLQHHHYYTDYCKNKLGEGKAKNIALTEDAIARKKY